MIPLGNSGCGAAGTGLATTTGTNILTDGRGVFRPQMESNGLACDLGAFQTAQNQVQMTFKTSPASGPSYFVGPMSYTGQQMFTLPVDTVSTLWAPTPQSSGAARYTFESWSDSGAQAHPITISPALTSETANFLKSVAVTINTSPQGLLVSVDGGAKQAAPVHAVWQVGSKHTIATTTPQRVTGIDYESPVWSDGGAISHTVTASASTISYTATFEVFYELTMKTSPAAGGTVTPSLGGFYPAGSKVTIEAYPNSGYTFKNWTGNVANSTSKTTTVTMTAPQTVTGNFAKK